MEQTLPELSAVPWRERAGERSLAHSERLWTATTIAHTVPFITIAVLLPLLDPVMAIVAPFALAFAWAIPELYAARGAGVLRPPRPARRVRRSRRGQRSACSPISSGMKPARC